MANSDGGGILAIDIGTSSIRATVFDDRGAVVAAAEQPTPARHEAGGRVTLDPASLWPLVASVVREAVPSRAIAAVGVTAQLGIVLVDAGGVAVSPVLLWADSRAADHVPFVTEQLSGISGLRTGRRITGESTAARLSWFARTEPETLERASRVISLKDWLVLKLTGEFVTDPVHASYSLLFDIPTASWSAEAFDAIGVSPSLAPAVREAHEAAGAVSSVAADETGLPEGVVVAVGGPDGTVGSLGAGATRPGRSVDIAGSTDVLVHLLDSPVIDDRSVVTTNAYLAAGMWTVGGATAITGGAVDWLARLAGATGSGAFIARFGAESSAFEPGAHGVLMDTALGTHRFPYWGSGRRSGILGASPRTGFPELLAAAREGAAFTVRDGLAELARVGARPERLTVVGGLARDPRALQLRADVCRLPVLGIGDGMATTRGAAALAGCAAGLFADLEQAVDAVAIEGSGFEPDEARSAQYDDVYETWSRAFATEQGA